ncbi:ribosomal protein S18-alanine N-acetyltransferase [Convivina praedatoris]|uniref:N-alpha-acetyltransferase RimI n=2 Tax=Convivina praedatoris TaxID=2880963 RepID=A0ABM9D0W3_9LACO|nr:ribosomal protein S18-alanine N-acetyltransferase [Convivina sp. LMG 32447]CAH1852377.1 N-alpha-acetyltransferase RimI [Convivina sp. LMG 32447]CAH1852416.1 N-alpha-acetyltransferase RimI [Convivina sp. LMG 32447]CAH1855190.1 N-alpha-acetyltransferase RimI [Convivina sp. LMG 32447]
MFLKSNGQNNHPLMPFQVFESQMVVISETRFTIRYAQAADIEQMVAIQEAVYDGYSPWQAADFSFELRHPEDRIYLVVEHEHRLVAFIGLVQRAWYHDLHITNLAVLPIWQGHGIGSFLLKMVQKLGEELNLPATSLEVRASNHIARRLYEKIGYQTIAIIKEYYRDNHEDALSMVLNIDR